MLAEDDVGGFQVAMEDSPAVGVVDGVANVDKPPEQLAEGQRALTGIFFQALVTVKSGDGLLEAIPSMNLMA